jgi:hypothetical protein
MCFLAYAAYAGPMKQSFCRRSSKAGLIFPAGRISPFSRSNFPFVILLLIVILISPLIARRNLRFRLGVGLRLGVGVAGPLKNVRCAHSNSNIDAPGFWGWKGENGTGEFRRREIRNPKEIRRRKVTTKVGIEPAMGWNVFRQFY